MPSRIITSRRRMLRTWPARLLWSLGSWQGSLSGKSPWWGPDVADDRLRLLFCHTDKTVTEIPAYTGPVEFDDTLNHRLAEHVFGDGRAHDTIVGDIDTAEWVKDEVKYQ